MLVPDFCSFNLDISQLFLHQLKFSNLCISLCSTPVHWTAQLYEVGPAHVTSYVLRGCLFSLKSIYGQLVF